MLQICGLHRVSDSPSTISWTTHWLGIAQWGSGGRANLMFMFMIVSWMACLQGTSSTISQARHLWRAPVFCRALWFPSLVYAAPNRKPLSFPPLSSFSHSKYQIPIMWPFHYCWVPFPSPHSPQFSFSRGLIPSPAAASDFISTKSCQSILHQLFPIWGFPVPCLLIAVLRWCTGILVYLACLLPSPTSVLFWTAPSTCASPHTMPSNLPAGYLGPVRTSLHQEALPDAPPFHETDLHASLCSITSATYPC